jgi:hypothetical protein
MRIISFVLTIIAFSTSISLAQVTCGLNQGGWQTTATNLPLRIMSNPSVNAQTRCTASPNAPVGYNVQQFNQRFCDSYTLPLLTDQSQPASLQLLVNAYGPTPSPGPLNDAAVVGRIDNGGQFLPNSVTQLFNNGAGVQNFNIQIPANVVDQSLFQPNRNAAGNAVLDIYAQDDSTIIASQLSYCVSPAPSLQANLQLLRQDQEQIDSPWGPLRLPIFKVDEQIVLNLNGTQNGVGYFLGLEEVGNTFSATNFLPGPVLFPGQWMGANTPPATDIVNNLIPNGYNGNTGRLRPQTQYLLTVATGPIWQVAYLRFYVH